MLKSQAQDMSRNCESACEQARSSDRARHAVEQKMVRYPDILRLKKLMIPSMTDLVRNEMLSDFTPLYVMQQSLMAKAKALEKDTVFYKEVNAQLELNQAGLEAARKRIQEFSEEEQIKRDAIIQDLQDQVRSGVVFEQ